MSNTFADYLEEHAKHCYNLQTQFLLKEAAKKIRYKEDHNQFYISNCQMVTSRRPMKNLDIFVLQRLDCWNIWVNEGATTSWEKASKWVDEDEIYHRIEIFKDEN